MSISYLRVEKKQKGRKGEAITKRERDTGDSCGRVGETRRNGLTPRYPITPNNGGEEEKHEEGIREGMRLSKRKHEGECETKKKESRTMYTIHI